MICAHARHSKGAACTYTGRPRDDVAAVAALSLVIPRARDASRRAKLWFFF